MKVKFNVKYGENEIEIPLPDQTQYPTFTKSALTDIWKHKVTIYNDIASDAVNPRRFERFVIDKCNIQGGIISKADGTIENIVNAITIITKDIQHYKQPLEYTKLPADLKEDFYTVQVGDFIVLSEVYDVVTTSREFAELQAKYSKNGIVVRSVSVNIHGTSVDNISMANVG